MLAAQLTDLFGVWPGRQGVWKPQAIPMWSPGEAWNATAPGPSGVHTTLDPLPPVLSCPSPSKVQVLYGGTDLFDYEVRRTFNNDMLLAFISSSCIAALVYVLTSCSGRRLPGAGPLPRVLLARASQGCRGALNPGCQRQRPAQKPPATPGRQLRSRGRSWGAEGLAPTSRS